MAACGGGQGLSTPAPGVPPRRNRVVGPFPPGGVPEESQVSGRVRRMPVAAVVTGLCTRTPCRHGRELDKGDAALESIEPPLFEVEGVRTVSRGSFDLGPQQQPDSREPDGWPVPNRELRLDLFPLLRRRRVPHVFAKAGEVLTAGREPQTH